MSKLLADAASFKSTLKRQDYTSWHSQPGMHSTAAPPPPITAATETTTTTTTTTDKKKARPKTNVVFSQPADTGTGQNLNTQLLYIIDTLKSSQNPRRLEDLAFESNVPNLINDVSLQDKLKAHDRVAWDAKTNLYSYKHEFNFRSKAELLVQIQRQTKMGKGGRGIPIRDLKDAWKDAPSAIEELEADGEVYVTRTLKDGQMKMVFWNEVKPGEETGGMAVEKEFYDLWHTLKVPNDVDMLRQLSSDGLQATAAEMVIPKAPQGKKKGKKGSAPRQRQVRITNTHLKEQIDLTKDFVPPGKS